LRRFFLKNAWSAAVILRCTLDGLLLPAQVDPHSGLVTALDATESFTLDAIEAIYYQLTSATEAEWLAVEAHYRLLRKADDFQRLC
jgi:hypothetical protein